METPEEVGTPITSNFKRLDVETLVLDAGSISGAKAEEEERRKWPFVFSPVQSMQQTAVRMHTADRDRCAPPSPLSPWLTDSRVSGQVDMNHVQYGYSPHNMLMQQRQQQQQFPSQSAGGTTRDRVCRRNRASSSLTRQESRSRDGNFFRSRSRSRSPSVSPPLPPPPLVMEESPRSQDRTHQDFGQITRSVCEEGASLERFLALEVAPAAQKIFDAAVVQHSKACRLLDVEHIGGLVSLDSDQEEDEHPSNRSPSRDSFKNDAKNEHASVGQNTSVASSDTVVSLNTPGASTEAWRRAVRAGVINIGSPSALSPRPSLPARKSDAYFAGAGDACESPRWSISGRFAARKQEKCGRKELVETPKAIHEEEEEPTEGVRRNAHVSRHEGDHSMTAAPDERRNESCDDSEEDDDEGLLNLSRQIAVDIGSKIVGLSSRIRRKAAEASQGLRNF